MPKILWIPALIAVLVFLFLGHGFGAESQVRYDPNLTKAPGKLHMSSFGSKKQVKAELTLTHPGVIELVIENTNRRSSGVYEALHGTIRNGTFSFYHEFRPGLTYPRATKPKRQGLTLDKKTYQKGDMVTGRIDFEGLEKPITVKGVFKTILK
jgi:hypothetical protein